MCKIDHKRWKNVKKLLFYDLPKTILAFSRSFLFACTVLLVFLVKSEK